MQEAIAAIFDTIANADAAEAELRTIVPISSIRRYEPEGSTTTATTTQEHEHHGSFWAWLMGDEQHEDRSMYEGHATAGRVILSVRCTDSTQAAQVMRILEGHSPTSIETTDDTGETPSALTPRATETTAGTPLAAGTVPAGISETTETGLGTAGNTARTEEVIPLSSEQLQVGKRVVDQGTTRIRRYVVNTPVEETVGLRNETTTVERRKPVAGSTPEAGAFEERTVEVHNTAEEAVVNKTAGVAEEVVVQKVVTETPETVRDTVRREEVEVDKPTRSKP